MRLLSSGVLLGLAWFAACNVIASVAAWVAARVISRRPTASATLLLTLRLLPAVASVVFVVAVFLPAHWLFEPPESDESFGIALVALALLSLLMLWGALRRMTVVASGVWRLRTHLRGVPGGRDGEACHVSGLPGVALAGVFQTRILIGAEARAALSPAELDAAIAHELAHRRSRDNLKRSAMFCAPDLLGWSPAARQLEARWSAEAECLADAAAAGGDDARALHLASALLKVARLGSHSSGVFHSPVWSTFHEPPLLEQRVRRLVAGTVTGKNTLRRSLGMPRLAALLIGASLALWLYDIPYQVHRLTEALIEILP